MEPLPVLRLHPGREKALERHHPWVFSGAIAHMEGSPTDGDLVRIADAEGRIRAVGHYQDSSIAVRILAYEDRSIELSFFIERFQQALEKRRLLGLLDNPETNCFRWVHGEGDYLPGLIVDVYGAVAVVQCHSIGMYRQLDLLAEAMALSLPGRLKSIYSKSAASLPSNFAKGVEDGFVHGKAPKAPLIALENGHRFVVDWEQGQKTGFFLDQRENRVLLARYAAGKRILNLFSYSGGFSIYALKSGAAEVTSVDASQKALEWLETNIELNHLPPEHHHSHCGDALKFLRKASEPYDIVVVDPPAFSKSLKKQHNAVQGYKRLNAVALQKVAPGGLLFTFSCSQVVDKVLFDNTIRAAALEAGRRAVVLHHLAQAPDHPVSLFHPESGYLKGLVLLVE